MRNTTTKQVGWTLFYIWLGALVITGIVIVLSARGITQFSYFGIVTMLASLVLPPIWALMIGNKLVKVIVYAPIILSLLLWLFTLIELPHKITGNSMEPNLYNGDYVLSSRFGYFSSQPKRGDIIVFTPPPSIANNDFVARIVGLPGEKIAIRLNHVYINDAVLDEPYLANDTVTLPNTMITTTDVQIPSGSYAVLGDNRQHSNDSRYYGFIQSNSIQGPVSFIYWPSERSGFVTSGI